MKNPLNLITDENSILITAEFLENSEILKVGESKYVKYEIDLIVKNDITINNLLTGIKQGLKDKLLNDCHFDVNKDDTELIYCDYKHPESESHIEDVAEKALGLTEGIGFFKHRRVKRVLKEYEKSEEAYKALSDGSDYEVPDNRNEEEKQLFFYLVCWNVFNECYNYYKSDYVLKNDIDMIKYGSKREPTIGISSVNYSAIKMGTKLAESNTFKICISDVNDIQLKDLGFITTTRIIFDPIGCHKSAALFDKTIITPAFREQIPLYNISDRPLKVLDETTVNIISPTAPPVKSKLNLLSTFLSPILMFGMVIAYHIMSSNGGIDGSYLLMGGMSCISIIIAILNVIERNRSFKSDTQKWKNEYENYIKSLIAAIQKKQQKDIEALDYIYPPAISGDGSNNGDLVEMAQTINGDIFSRDSSHPDFLKIRIGISTENSKLVPSVFKINGEKKETIFSPTRYMNIKNIPEYPFSIVLPNDKNANDFDGSEGYLINLPSDLAEEYSYLNNAPVLLSLYEARSVGFVFDDSCYFMPFLSNVILNLCFYHSPDNLQCIVFCNEESDMVKQQKTIRRFKHLPHFHELLEDISSFAFNKEDAYLILNKLLEILSERKMSNSEMKLPHIVMFIMQDYELKRHPVSEYLPSYGDDSQKNNYGISFVYCKRYTEELPKYCDKVIKRTSSQNGDEKWYLLPHVQQISDTSVESQIKNNNIYSFKNDYLIMDSDDNYYRAYKSLSALYYERIAQGSDVPTKVELFDVLDIEVSFEQSKMEKELNSYIKRSWGLEAGPDGLYKHNDETKTLSVSIGKKSSGLVQLDLHERSDGPHMLVAGTTGSGKTETILTFLTALCAQYTPDQVNLLLMDMKGAGFVDRIGDDSHGTKLPHVVGTVTDITGDEMGTGMNYMLKRFLDSMNSEVKSRKLYLKKMGVDSVDSYTEARNNLEKYIANHPTYDYEELKKLPPIPHLFLVIDEFTELMRITGENEDIDFKKSITSLARIGRSLGFHIILISQNIENAITPDIRVNSKARLCLKVATKDASKEMIGTDLAASPLMPGNGRAYLLVGTGSRFEYFQSGYSGVDVNRNVEPRVAITQVEASGVYKLFYDSKALEMHKINSEADVGASENLPQSDSQVNVHKDQAVPTEKAEKAESQHNSEPKVDVAREPHDFAQNNSNDSEDVVIQEKDEGITQLMVLVNQIRACYKEYLDKGVFQEPHCIFQQPLPNFCYYNYDWEKRDGKIVEKKKKDK